MPAKKAPAPSYLKDLLLLFSVPVAIILVALAALYTPRLLAHPKFDFVYTTCTSYDCRKDFTVDSFGHVQPPLPSETRDDADLPALRYYNAKEDATSSLTLAQAQRYRLNTSSKSPDGYRLVRANSSSQFLFWGSSDSGWYLQKGFAKRPLELATSSDYYGQNIKFLGWIEQ